MNSNSNQLNYSDDTTCTYGPKIPINSKITLAPGCDCGNINCKKYSPNNNIQNTLINDIEGFCGYGPERPLECNLKLARGCDCGNLDCGDYRTDNTIQNTLYQDIEYKDLKPKMQVEGFCGYGLERPLNPNVKLARGCDCGNIDCGDYRTNNTIQNTLYQDIQYQNQDPNSPMKIEGFGCGCGYSKSTSANCECRNPNCECPGNCSCALGCNCRYCRLNVREGFRGGHGGFSGNFGSDLDGSFEGRGSYDRYNFSNEYNQLANAPNTSTDSDWDYSEYNFPYLSEDILEKNKDMKKITTNSETNPETNPQKIEGFRGGGGGGGHGGGGFGGRGGGLDGGFGGYSRGGYGDAGFRGGDLRDRGLLDGYTMDSRFSNYHSNTYPDLNTYAYSTDGPGVSGGYVGFEPTDLPIYNPNYYMPYGYPNLVVDTPQQYLEDKAEEGVEEFSNMGGSGGRSGGRSSGRSGGISSGRSAGRSGGFGRSGSPSGSRSYSRSRSRSRSSSPSRSGSYSTTDRSDRSGRSGRSGRSDKYGKNKNVTINKYYNSEYPNDKPFNEPYPDRGTWRHGRYWPYGYGNSSGYYGGNGGYWDWPYYASPWVIPAVIGSNVWNDDGTQEPTTINNITINAEPKLVEESTNGYSNGYSNENSNSNRNEESEEFGSMQEKILAQTEKLKSIMLNEVHSKQEYEQEQAIAQARAMAMARSEAEQAQAYSQAMTRTRSESEQVRPDISRVYRKNDDMFENFDTFIGIVVIIILFIFIKQKSVV